MKIFRVGLLLAVMGAGTLRAETVAEQLIAGYERVQSVSCEIRRDMETSARKMRWLSRVYFQRPDRLHVDNSAPLPRRIVADGTNFFSYAEGDRKGFSRPIAQLDTDMLVKKIRVALNQSGKVLTSTRNPPITMNLVRRSWSTIAAVKTPNNGIR